MADPSPSDDSLEHSYDEVPYPGHAYAQSDPAHLYTLAKMFGLKPTKVESASILELGCSDGGNLIPMAFHFPNAKCVGIDLSGKEIAEGQKKIMDLKLSNIKLTHQSILDFNSNEKFDYVLCHGVYSWVDDKVKDKILQICDDNLSENGIVYISYNTYPGWHQPECIRDLFLWYTRNTKNPYLKATQARYILKYYTDGLKGSTTRYAEQFRKEFESLSNHSDGYLLHDHLSIYNQPVYFYQFMERATKHNLAYLCDSTLVNEYIDILDEPFVEDLNNIEDVVELGQRIDFIRNQRFRWTLLCHHSQRINRKIAMTDLEQYDIQLKGEINKADFSEKDIGQLHHIVIYSSVSHMEIPNPIAQMAISILNDNKHKPIPYNTLCIMVSEKVPHSSPDEIRNILRDKFNLISGIFAGLFEISSNSREYIVQVTAKPIACPLARYLALNGYSATNRRHENIFLDPISKCLLPFLDGSHDISSLREIAINRLKLETLNLLDDKNQPIVDKEVIDQRLIMLCHNTLVKLANQAFLIG